MKNHVSGVNAVLEQALGELEAEKDRVDEQIAVIRSVLNNGAGPVAHSRRAAQPSPKTGRRSMSAAARREVSERMTRYWAGRRAAKAKAARIAARPRRVVRKAKPIVVRVVRKRRPVVKRVARPVARKRPVAKKMSARKVAPRKVRDVRKQEIAQVAAPVEALVSHADSQ